MTNTLLSRSGAPTIDASTRRQFLTGVAAAGMLAACGQRAEPATEPAASSTRPVVDFFGTTVEVPVESRQIVAADDIALGNLLDLGVTPVATAVNRLSIPSFLGARTDGIEDISSTDELGVNLEALAAVRPDLIFTIGVDFGRDLYEAIRPIAPTFAYAYGYSTSEEIRTNMTELGRALGLEERAADEVKRLDDRVAGMRARLGEAGLDRQPVSVLRVGPDFYSIRHGSTESVLLAELGMTRPENQRSIEDFSTDLSFEHLEAVDGYALYVYVDTDGEADLAALEANPLWATLDVVGNDRVFLVDSGVWNGISLPAAHAILDDIESTLLA